MSKKFNIQIHGDKFTIEDGNVYIENVDPSQVAKEFYIGDLLEAFDFYEVEAWVLEKNREAEENANE